MAYTLETIDIIKDGRAILRPEKGLKIQKVKVFPPTFNEESKKIVNSAVVEDYQYTPEVKYRMTFLKEDE